MTHTPHFALPYLHPAQAGKEITHNEALLRIDALLRQRAQGIGADPTNLTAPVEGEIWLVAQNATGDWAGHDGAMALYNQGQWRFIPAVEGQRIWLSQAGYWLHFSDGAWQMPPLSPQIAPSAVEDAGARAALADVLNLLQNRGLTRPA